MMTEAEKAQQAEKDREGLIRSEFQVHKLNAKGFANARELAEAFSELLNNVESICGAGGREVALVRTHLEQASYYAKRAMASRPENQEA